MVESYGANGRTIWPKIDLSKGVVPVIMAVAVALAVAGASFTVGVVYAGVQRDTQQFRGEIGEIKSDLASIRLQVSALSASLQQYASQGERFTLNDFLHFCWQAERLNEGWKCPDPVSGARVRRSKEIDAYAPETSSTPH